MTRLLLAATPPSLGAVLRDNESLYRSIFRNAGVGIAVTALDGLLVEANDAYLRLLGLSRQEVLGRPPVEFTHPEDRPETTDKLAQVIAGRLDSYRVTKRYQHAGGTVRWADVNVSALRDAGGAVTGVIALCTDVTDTRVAEQALREASAEDGTSFFTTCTTGNCEDGAKYQKEN